MDTHSTSVIGFKGKDFVVFGTESRAVHFRYGNVTNDDELKIHQVCENVFGTGAGNGRMIRNVFKEARKYCSLNRPTRVIEAAEGVATVARRNLTSLPPKREPADFMVAGWMPGGCCEMYTIIPSIETMDEKTPGKRKDKEEKTSGKRKVKEEKTSGKRKDKDANKEEKTSGKRKDKDAMEGYEYDVEEVDKVFLGSGTKAMTKCLNGKEYQKYPLSASASLEEVKEVMKDAMRCARYYDFGSDGKFRVVSVSEGGRVHCSSVEPIRARPDAPFGDWIENEFTPVADVD